MNAKDIILARKMGGGGSGGGSGGGKGGAYEANSIDNGDGTQTLEITDSNGITDGIIVKARDANGYATEVDFYSSIGILGASIFYCPAGVQKNAWSELEKINLKSEVHTLRADAIFRTSKITKLIFPDVTTLDGGPIFDGLGQIDEVCFPKLATFNVYYLFYSGIDVSGASMQFGSIGYACNPQSTALFRNTTSSSDTVCTVYTSSTLADSVLARFRNGLTNATIIIKDSTTGETLVTSTP